MQTLVQYAFICRGYSTFGFELCFFFSNLTFSSKTKQRMKTQVVTTMMMRKSADL